jgi:hypothetical protein
MSAREAVDVVIPLRGPQPWIGECLGSLAAQSELPDRVIVVDDGIEGLDELLAIGRRLLEGRLDVIRNAGRGVGAGINTGVAASTATWIMRIDGDDVCHPQRLQLQRAFLQRHAGALDGCGTQARVIDRRGQVMGAARYAANPAAIAAQMHRTCNFLGPTMMVRREVFARHPLRPALSSVEDYDFALRAWQGGRLTNIAAPLVDYRMHPSQQSFDKRVRQTALSELVVRASLRRAQGAPDPLDTDPALVEAFVAWRLACPGYVPLRRLLTALRYARLHARHDAQETRRYLGIALRAALPALPAYPRTWTLLRAGHAGLARERSPFPALNL